jgi:hypothetical protein
MEIERRSQMNPNPRDIFILEIDRQTFFNKLQYDRSLDPMQRTVLAQRLQFTESELQRLQIHVETLPITPLP